VAVFRLFIDETGDHTRSEDGATPHGKRFLGLLGVMINQTRLAATRDEIEALKRRHLAYDELRPPILHRREIMKTSGPFKVLVDPVKRGAFNADLLDTLERLQFTVFAVALDKFTHGQKTYRKLSHPYHYGLLAMLERYCGLLDYLGATGDVMAEARGKAEDFELKVAYRGFYAGGWGYLRTETVKKTLTSREAKLSRKASNETGLQIADVLAYPLVRDVLRGEGLRSDCGGPFSDLAAKRLASKYNRHFGTGEIRSYGRIFLD